MLFWIFVILTVVGIVLYKLFDSDCGFIISLFSGMVVVVSLFIIIWQYITVDFFLEVNRERYKALTYKIESNICHDEFGLLSKEVIDEIQEWNEDLRHYQKIQDNFWLGIYYPNIFDEFEIIEYERYVK